MPVKPLLITGGLQDKLIEQSLKKEYKEFIRDEFAEQTIQYSQHDRFEAIAVLLIQVPMPVEDLQIVANILYKNQKKLS